MDNRIKETFDNLVESREAMMAAQGAMEDLEETAKMDNLNEWVAAKNNDVRRAIILRELSDNNEYHAHRRAYRDARDAFKLARLEVERIRMMVDAAVVATKLGI